MNLYDELLNDPLRKKILQTINFRDLVQIYVKNKRNDLSKINEIIEYSKDNNKDNNKELIGLILSLTALNFEALDTIDRLLNPLGSKNK
jgi:hypothetical protein